MALMNYIMSVVGFRPLVLLVYVIEDFRMVLLVLTEILWAYSIMVPKRVYPA